MPQMVDQLVAVLARFDMPLADQVIEVPKGLLSLPLCSYCSLYATDGGTAGGSAGGSLHGLSVPGSSSSSAVSREWFFLTFHQVKKKCDSTLRLWVGTASALDPMDSGSL